MSYSEEAEELAYAWERTGYPLEGIAEEHIDLRGQVQRLCEEVRSLRKRLGYEASVANPSRSDVDDLVRIWQKQGTDLERIAQGFLRWRELAEYHACRANTWSKP